MVHLNMSEKIEFDKYKYTVIDCYEFSDYKGCYRSILYDTGYYAIQYAPSIDELWTTILICPYSESTGEINWDGELIINSIIQSIEEADDSFNGDNWNLNLQLDNDEVFTEVITKGEGETLLEQMFELVVLVEEYNEDYMKYYPMISRAYTFFICIVSLILLYCFLHFVIHLI